MRRTKGVIFMMRILLGVLGWFSMAAGAVRAVPPPAVPDAPTTESLRDTSSKVISEVMANFFNSPAIKKNSTYTILPVTSDSPDAYYYDQFRNAFTQKAVGGTLKLYSGSGPQFQALIETFANSQDIHDALAPATIQRLGKMIDFEAVIIPRVNIESSGDGVQIFRASMGVYSRETGEITWGGEARQRIPGKLSNDELMRYAKWAIYGALLLLILIFLIRRIVIASRPR